MHDHDIDIVMAMAAGEAVDATDASAVMGCPECSADLSAQKAALAALGALSPARLDEAERTRLRAAVMSEINLSPEPARSARPSRPVGRLARWTWAWAGAAALVLVGFVAVAGLFDGLSVGGSDADTVALEATSTTLVDEDALRSQEAPLAGENSDSLESGTSTAPSGDGLADAGSLESTTGAVGPLRYDFEALSPTDLQSFSRFSNDEVAARLGDEAQPTKPLSPELSAACEDAGLSAVPEATNARVLFTGTYQGTAALLWVYDTPDGPVTVVHDGLDCSVITLLP